ncbi:MAG: PQ-loop repeat-containing protein [Caldimonas sp.]
MQFPTTFDLSAASSIAWFYLVSNSLRGFTYLPQIIVAWRSRDGARSLSLLTWGAWLVANAAAVLYGLVLHDAFFTSISLINCTGCAVVTAIAAKRRQQWKRKSRATSSLLNWENPPAPEQATPRVNRGHAVDGYLARWGYSPRWLADGSIPIQNRASRATPVAANELPFASSTLPRDGAARTEPPLRPPATVRGVVSFLGLEGRPSPILMQPGREKQRRVAILARRPER